MPILQIGCPLMLELRSLHSVLHAPEIEARPGFKHEQEQGHWRRESSFTSRRDKNPGAALHLLGWFLAGGQGTGAGVGYSQAAAHQGGTSENKKRVGVAEGHSEGAGFRTVWRIDGKRRTVP